MKKQISKKGSAAVYTVVIMTGLIALFTALIGAVREEAAAGTVQAAGRLWADSIIAEYDLRLFQEYGIFAYIGTPADTEEKILEMADYTFGSKNYAEVGECICLPEEYSLAAAENFKDQIVTAGKASEIDLIIQDFTGPFTGETADIPESEERTIRSQRVLNSLPSSGRSAEGIFERAGEFFGRLGSLGGIITEGTDMFFIDRYIRTHFRNQISDKSLENRYLMYEEEYILFGKKSDAANRRAAKTAIISIREVMNLSYLNTCDIKKNEALAAGALLMPEAPEVMQQTLLAAWALAESFNDYELLIHGKPVPFVKDDDSWATTLTGVLEELVSGYGYIDTGCESGSDYEDYISAMMFLLPEDIKLLRMMDLIQLNLKYTYRADFLITDCYVGVEYLIEVNGKDYAFSAEY